jgi:hypothetical protein
MTPHRSVTVFALAWTLGCGSSSGKAGTVADGGADATSTDAASDAGPATDGPSHPTDGASSTDGPSDAAHDAALDGPAGADAGDGGGPAQAIGIPMYVDPSSSAAAWAQVTSAAPTVALLVANPASGPGTSAQAEYTGAIATAHAAGQTIVGYVHTSYGARALALVEADVDSWYSFYPAIDGVFVDEGATDTATIAPYYQPLHDHVKAEPAGPRTVILNPGTIVDEGFMATADVIVSFEDTYANYTNGSYPTNPAWMAGYPRWRFWHLVLSAATTTEMQNAVTIARQRNAGYVYVTAQGPATAYQQLVSGAYWQAELSAVQAP